MNRLLWIGLVFIGGIAVLAVVYPRPAPVAPPSPPPPTAPSPPPLPLPLAPMK